jgi:hypothetical protein
MTLIGLVHADKNLRPAFRPPLRLEVREPFTGYCLLNFDSLGQRPALADDSP